MYSNMVLLTVVTTSNPHTLYFDHPIEKPNYIRLLSASLYNSWQNLKKSGAISTLPDGNGSPSVIPFEPGHYTIDGLAEEFAFIKKNKPAMDITARVHKAIGLMVIHNPKGIRFSVNLVELLGVNPALKPITIIEKLNSPSTYFVHCDLIDKRQNLLNGKPSTVLARFDVRGQPFEKVHYQTPQPHVLRDTDSGDYDVNSITLSVKDENENLFDFKGYSLEFELEIN